MFQGSDSKQKEWAPEFIASRVPSKAAVAIAGGEESVGGELGSPFLFVMEALAEAPT